MCDTKFNIGDPVKELISTEQLTGVVIDIKHDVLLTCFLYVVLFDGEKEPENFLESHLESI